MEPQATLFGSLARSKVLVAVALLRDSYSREISRLTGVPLFTVQRVVRGLERDGIIETRSMGTTNMLSLNRRLSGVDDLSAFLIKYSKRLPDLVEAIESARRRPRRSGKEL